MVQLAVPRSFLVLPGVYQYVVFVLAFTALRCRYFLVFYGNLLARCYLPLWPTFRVYYGLCYFPSRPLCNVFNFGLKLTSILVLDFGSTNGLLFFAFVLCSSWSLFLTVSWGCALADVFFPCHLVPLLRLQHLKDSRLLTGSQWALGPGNASLIVSLQTVLFYVELKAWRTTGCQSRSSGCKPVSRYRRFGEMYCLNCQGNLPLQPWYLPTYNLTDRQQHRRR